jgi:hypothetical protein
MTTTFDAEARLLIDFFQQAIQVGEVEPDPAKYLGKFRVRGSVEAPHGPKIGDGHL